MIRESIVTTLSADKQAHIAPMGVQREGDYLLLAPFRPSRSLENMLRDRCAVINYTDDVRIFAGCLSGHAEWPVCPAESVHGIRLQNVLSHTEVLIKQIRDDNVRPQLLCQPVFEAMHAPFSGFNRAQSAVIEAAILVSRLHMLPWDKIETEIGYLTIAIEKTAGPREQIAWDWLMDKVAQHRAKQLEQRA